MPMEINGYPYFYYRLNPDYYESMRTRSALLPEQNHQRDPGQEKKTKQQEQKIKDETPNHASKEITMAPEDEKSDPVLGDINNNDIADEKSVPAAEMNVHEKGSKVACPDPGESEVVADGNDEATDENLNNNNAEENVINHISKDDDKKNSSEEKTSPHVDNADDDVATDLSTKTPSKKPDDTKDEASSFLELKKDDESNMDISSYPISAKFAFSGGIPGFPPNPALLSGQLQSNFARSLSAQFYNSLSMLASQAILNVKDEPKDNNYQSYNQSSPENITTQTIVQDDVQPARTSSRNSLVSNQSFDGNCPRSHSPRPISFSPALSGGSEAPQRPLSELSPKALAEQLRNNDSASMVVCRQQKFPGRSAGYAKQHYSSSGGGTPPPSFPTLSSSNNEPYSGGLEIPTTNTNSNSSPSLHHFTTRYTIEMPADPSRLGVELILDHDNAEPVIEVECGGNRGLLYISKLCQGSKGQSILFNDEWLTPNEFQFISGRETAKDWKRSIRHCGKSLKTLMTKGILQVHPPVCECQQCRGAQGSKILANKKHMLKDNSKKVKSSPTSDVKLSPGFDASMMMRPGFDGGLSSIISQLHKANGFETNDGSETLDLTTKTNWKRSSSPLSRKHQRDDSFSERKLNSSLDNVSSTSPVQKRAHSENEEEHNFDGSTFTSTYPYLPSEEQYRRMMALLNRSLSPGDPQFPLYNMPSMDSLRLHTANFPDLAALQNAFQLESNLYNNRARGKTKSHHSDARKESGAFDLTRNMKDKTDFFSRKRDLPFPQSHSKNLGNKNDKYRKTDRNYSPLDGRRSRTEHTKSSSHGYIALESRSRGASFNSSGNNRDNFRGWPNNTMDLGYRRQEPVIDLNVSGSSVSGRAPDWNSKLSSSWFAERNHFNKKPNDWKQTAGSGTASPNRKTNGTFRGLFPDQHIILDRIPINKNPVTTLHHRPNFNHDNEPPSYPHHTQQLGSSKLTASHRYDNRSKPHTKESRYNRSRSPSAEGETNMRMPMLDLQKHAVPVVSLTGCNVDKNMDSCATARNEPDDQDTGFREISARRQSSSAPPPRLQSQDDHRVDSRPKSAQDGMKLESLTYDSRPHFPISTPSLRQKTNFGRNSSSQYHSQSVRTSSTEHMDWKYSSLLTEKNHAIQQALDEMHSWTVDDVCSFICRIDPVFENFTEEFKRHELDGEGLPLLTEHHLMDFMKMKLGQALKIVAHIKRFLTIYADSVTCCHRSLVCNDFLLTQSSKTTEKAARASAFE